MGRARKQGQEVTSNHGAGTAQWQAAKTRQHRAKREAIIVAATRKFMDQGYADTTLADVADELGVTNKALYYYFKNKEDLALECFIAGQEWIRESLNRCDRLQTTGYDKMRTHLEYAVRESGAHGPLMTEVPIQLEHTRRGHEIRNEQIAQLDILLGWIRTGQSDGSVRQGDPYVLWNLIFGSLSRMHNWARADNKYGAKAVDAALYLVERLLKA